MSECYISRLPIELMLRVVAYLDIRSISAVAETCKEIRAVLRFHRPAILTDLCTGLYSQEFELWYREAPSLGGTLLNRPCIGRILRKVCMFERPPRALRPCRLKEISEEKWCTLRTMVCDLDSMIFGRDEMLRTVLECTVPCNEHARSYCFNCSGWHTLAEDDDLYSVRPSKHHHRLKLAQAQHVRWEDTATINSMLYQLDDIQTRIADIVAMIQSVCAGQQHLMPSKKDLHTAVLVHLRTTSMIPDTRVAEPKDYFDAWICQYRTLSRFSMAARRAYAKFLRLLRAVFAEKWDLRPWTEAAKNSGHPDNSDPRYRGFYDSHEGNYVILAVMANTLSELCVLLSEPAREVEQPPCGASCVLAGDWEPEFHYAFHSCNNQVVTATDTEIYYRSQMMHFIHFGIKEIVKYTEVLVWHLVFLHKAMRGERGLHWKV